MVAKIQALEALSVPVRTRKLPYFLEWCPNRYLFVMVLRTKYHLGAKISDIAVIFGPISASNQP
jgi:hypothetical protein